MTTKKPKEITQKLPYEILKYNSNMKYCSSKDPCLRPTYAIQSDAPEIIALANSLGAYQKSDWDYANAAFEWVKRNIKFRFIYYDTAVEVLKHGRAHCIGNMNLFAALCRCAGIPTRYVLDTIGVEGRTFDFFSSELELGNVNEIIRFTREVWTQMLPHQVLEIKIGEVWVPADPVFTPEIEAVMGYPIVKLGEKPEWLGVSEGNYIYTTSFPFLLGTFSKLFIFLTPGLSAMLEKSFVMAEEKGRRIIEEVGGEEKYNKKQARMNKAKDTDVSSIMGKLMSEEN